MLMVCTKLAQLQARRNDCKPVSRFSIETKTKGRSERQQKHTRDITCKGVVSDKLSRGLLKARGMRRHWPYVERKLLPPDVVLPRHRDGYFHTSVRPPAPTPPHMSTCTDQHLTCMVGLGLSRREIYEKN